MTRISLGALLLSSLFLFTACANSVRWRMSTRETPALVVEDQDQDRRQSRRERQEREARRARERRQREEQRYSDRERRRQAERERQRRREEERRDRRDRRDRYEQGEDPDWPERRHGRRGRNRDRDGRRRRSRGRNRDRRGSRHRGSYALFSWSDGDFDHDDNGRGLDHNSANMFRLRTGSTTRSGKGGGLDVKFHHLDDDIFLSTGSRSELDQLDVYGFATGEVGASRFRMPIRVGPYFNSIWTERVATGRKTNYHGIGLRIEIAPEINLMRREDQHLALFCNLSAGGHLTGIDDEVTDEIYGALGTTLGFEPGIRWVSGGLELRASYHAWQTTIRRSEEERGVRLPRIENEFEGFQFSIGFRF